MKSAIFFVISSLAFASSLPAGVKLGKNGEVSASFGGYSASAGLNGPNGGLHAEAGTPEGPFAAAGLGGNSGLYGVASTGTGAGAAAGSAGTSATASSSASAGSGSTGTKPHPVKGSGATIFDEIFNIPQSVLRSVNDLLNKRAYAKGQLPPPGLYGGHGGHPVAVLAFDEADKANGVLPPGPRPPPVAVVGAAAGGAGAHTKYDDIFNALK